MVESNKLGATSKECCNPAGLAFDERLHNSRYSRRYSSLRLRMKTVMGRYNVRTYYKATTRILVSDHPPAYVL